MKNQQRPDTGPSFRSLLEQAKGYNQNSIEAAKSVLYIIENDKTRNYLSRRKFGNWVVLELFYWDRCVQFEFYIGAQWVAYYKWTRGNGEWLEVHRGEYALNSAEDGIYSLMNWLLFPANCSYAEDRSGLFD